MQKHVVRQLEGHARRTKDAQISPSRNRNRETKNCYVPCPPQPDAPCAPPQMLLYTHLPPHKHCTTGCAWHTEQLCSSHAGLVATVNRLRLARQATYQKHVWAGNVPNATRRIVLGPGVATGCFASARQLQLAEIGNWKDAPRQRPRSRGSFCNSAATSKVAEGPIIKCRRYQKQRRLDARSVFPAGSADGNEGVDPVIHEGVEAKVHKGHSFGNLRICPDQMRWEDP